MSQVAAQTSISGRHRPRVLHPAAKRPAEIGDAYRLAHPGRIRTIGRRETREERLHRARRAAARERFLADVNRDPGTPLVVPA